MEVSSLVQKVQRVREFNFWPGAQPGVPELPGALPVVGHTVSFVRDTIGLLKRAQREMGEVAALRVAHLPMVAMFGPEAQAAVFRAPDAQLNPQEAYKIMTPVFGEGMVYDAPPDKMNEQLKMLIPALKDRRMRTYGETIVDEVEQSIANWGDEGEIELVDYCRMLTNFTSSHTLLGREFREGMTDEFARVYHDLERGVTPLAYLNANLPIPSFRKRDQARVRLVEMISEIVAQRRHSGRTGEDFLQTMMDASYKSGVPLSDDEITGMLLAAMFAGHHTSSVTTAWTLIELLQNPHYLERMLAQLDATFGDEGSVDYHSLKEIDLTEYAVKEALRLHPPLFMLIRVVMQRFRYKEHDLAPGTWIVVSPTVAHRMGEVFADPNRFDPERFAPPRSEDKQMYAFIPFGGGRHKCLGHAFALLQVKAILAVLLRRYTFELATRDVGEDFHGLVVGPTQPCRVRYRRRRPRS
ncbi:MAG: cytochrome P450 [Myxococcota bacterium]